MTRVNTIPHKIPKKILKKIETKEYDEIILFTLSVFGPHKLDELINDPSKNVNNRLDRELFLQTAEELIEKNFITSVSKEKDLYYQITLKGEDELMKCIEDYRIVKRLLNNFSSYLGPIDEGDNLNVRSISGYTLSYKDLIFGLLSIYWRINTFLEAPLEYGEIGPETNISLGKVIQDNAEKYSQNIAIKYEETEYTYEELNDWVNKYANYFLSLGIKKGEVINVMLENRPEIMFIIAAMSKIGAIASLINTRQRAATLTHSLAINKVRFYIVGEELFEAFEEVKSNLDLNENQILFFLADNGDMTTPEGYIDLIKDISKQESKNPPSTQTIKGKYTYAYIFTSGTTGLPKAAHMRNMHTAGSMVGWGKLAFHTEPDDVMYICLPLFHSNAIQVGWASALYSGASVAIGRRFSVRDFWKDCIRYGATCFNYIGEICRYLLNQPSSPLDRKHNIYKIGGNGLTPEIWNEFKERFGIKEVYEHYGMTEMIGMFCNYFNLDKTVGFCFDPYAIVKYDVDNDKAILNGEGFYQEVEKGEAGLFLLKMRDQYTFAGYTDKISTRKKIIHDVFEKGDAWYNTGDMLRNIGYKHAQFVDRLGDTFRWKGENVSTTEVEDVISLSDQIKLSSVYGVQIPGAEGRVGMASVMTVKSHDEFNFKIFLDILKKNLPKYAIPKFICFLSGLSTTSTYKIQKSEMKNVGYDISKTNDRIYVLLPGSLEYTLLTEKIYNNIIGKGYRF